MERDNFIVPQEINFDTAAKVLTEKQIAVIGIVTAVIGGPFFLLFPSDLGKLLGLLFGAAIGFALAKIEMDGVILWDYLTLLVTFSHEKKVYVMENILPIKDIKDGIIELENGTYSVLYEMTGITYDMMGEGAKAIVLQSLIESLYSVEGKISFYALRKRFDVNTELKRIRELEDTSPNKEYYQSYKSMLVQTIKEKDIGTMRYFVVVNAPDRETAVKRGNTFRETLEKSGVFRIRRIYSPISILYEVMNIHRSYYQKVEEGEGALYEG